MMIAIAQPISIITTVHGTNTYVEQVWLSKIQVCGEQAKSQYGVVGQNTNIPLIYILYVLPQLQYSS